VTESKNIQSDLIPKIATGFCGGISHTCGLCGAVSGAIMAIGLFTGRSNSKDSSKKNYAAVQRLMGEFEGKFSSTNCKELIGCDLGTKKGYEDFKAKGRMKQCSQYTEEATRIAMTIIEEE
jgi:C_GCAxxG_C_C family probable redox protein